MSATASDTALKPILFCQSCIYFQGIPDKTTGVVSGGVCKRHPPTPLIVYGTDLLGKAAMNLQSHFPPIAAGEWCGEHATDEEEAELN